MTWCRMAERRVGPTRMDEAAWPSLHSIRFARGCMPACPAHPPHLHAVVPPTLYEQSGSEKCGQSANSRGKMRGASALVDASQP